jgi:hypothetical protein
MGEFDMRYLALFAPLLLGGCLEALDVVEAELAAPRYCHTATATFLCEPPQRPLP